MKINLEIYKFGKILNSRPSGREAVLRARQIINGAKDIEKISLDLSEVDIITPSFADEFITGIKESYKGSEIEITGYSNNIVIKDTLKALNFI